MERSNRWMSQRLWSGESCIWLTSNQDVYLYRFYKRDKLHFKRNTDYTILLLDKCYKYREVSISNHFRLRENLWHTIFYSSGKLTIKQKNIWVHLDEFPNLEQCTVVEVQFVRAWLKSLKTLPGCRLTCSSHLFSLSILVKRPHWSVPVFLWLANSYVLY